MELRYKLLVIPLNNASALGDAFRHKPDAALSVLWLRLPLLGAYAEYTIVFNTSTYTVELFQFYNSNAVSAFTGFTESVRFHAAVIFQKLLDTLP